MSIALLSLFRIFQNSRKVDFVPHAKGQYPERSPLSITPNWRKPNELPLKKPSLVRTHVAKKPLRVSRVLEAHGNKNSVGRMVISGSMKDVCAELDRLVMLENSTLSH